MIDLINALEDDDANYEDQSTAAADKPEMDKPKTDSTLAKTELVDLLKTIKNTQCDCFR